MKLLKHCSPVYPCSKVFTTLQMSALRPHIRNVRSETRHSYDSVQKVIYGILASSRPSNKRTLFLDCLNQRIDSLRMILLTKKHAMTRMTLRPDRLLPSVPLPYYTCPRRFSLPTPFGWLSTGQVTRKQLTQPIPAKELASQLREHSRFQDVRGAFCSLPHPSSCFRFLGCVHLVLLTVAGL